jgi:hypothetical protein
VLSGALRSLNGALRSLNGVLRSLSVSFRFVSGFWGFENKICQSVRDEIFFPHIILGVGKQ